MKRKSAVPPLHGSPKSHEDSLKRVEGLKPEMISSLNESESREGAILKAFLLTPKNPKK